ncbi:MAG TPA: hypothetical protein VK419_17165, partial [Bryobacteraceae bacterium]|nr:hypothetical protein [Bryobacteraceae bacterium]
MLKSISLCARLAICLAIFTVQPGSIFGQTSDPPPADPKAALIQELEAMKKRIEQLEAQLRKMQDESAAAPKLVSVSVPATPQPASSAVAATTQPASTPAVAAPQSVASLGQATPPAAPQGTPPPAAQPEPAKPAEPFAFGDWTWLTGNARTTESPMDTKFFTPEIRADVDYVYDYNHPADHTIGGSSEVFRAGEVQLTQLGVGGDFHWQNVR